MTANQMYALALLRKQAPALTETQAQALAKLAQEHGTKHGWSVLGWASMAATTLNRGGSVHGIQIHTNPQNGI